MPALGSRGGARGRRSLAEINMVPFIDVMLVLLIIFMVTAPLITTGVVNLPSVGKSQARPPKVIEVIVGADDKLRLRTESLESVEVALAQLPKQVRSQQAGDANTPVIISADKSVRYESVVRVMDSLQRAGVLRVGLSVKRGG